MRSAHAEYAFGETRKFLEASKVNLKFFGITFFEKKVTNLLPKASANPHLSLPNI